MSGPQGSVEDIEGRIEWARSHIDIVNGEVNLVMSHGGPYRAVPEVQSDGQSYIYRAETNFPIPPSLSFVVADCIHNLRASLDNLTFQLIHCYGPAGLVGFPVCRDANDFQLFTATHFQKLPPEAVAEFERLQPYHRSDQRWHPIRLMNRLWNRDKHRARLVSGALPGGVISLWEVESGDPQCLIYPDVSVEDGVVVAAAIVRPGEQAKFKANITIGIGINEPGPTLSRILPSTLINMHAIVRYEALDRLKPFFR